MLDNTLHVSKKKKKKKMRFETLKSWSDVFFMHIGCVIFKSHYLVLNLITTEIDFPVSLLHIDIYIHIVQF